MKRFYKIIVKNLFPMLYITWKLERMIKQGKSDDEIYKQAQRIPRRFHKSGRVNILFSGKENIPADEEGCLFIPNHQGRCDAMVVLQGLADRPTSFVINDARSHMFVIRQIVDALKAKRIKFDDAQDQLRVYNEMSREISEGRRFVVFPEAEYTDDKKNTLREFHAACLRPAFCSKRSIVPVCLYDTWKIFECDKEKSITVQCHFLSPISYEEYGKLSRPALAELIKSRIQEKIDEIELEQTK